MKRNFFCLISLVVVLKGGYASAIGSVTGSSTSVAAIMDTSSMNSDLPNTVETDHKQNKMFNVSPQDKGYDIHKLDDSGSYHAPKVAPNDQQSDSKSSNKPFKANSGDIEKGSKGSVILADYDSNRLGVSADEANNKADDKKTKLGSVVGSKNPKTSKQKDEKDTESIIKENKASTYTDEAPKKDNVDENMKMEEIKESKQLKLQQEQVEQAHGSDSGEKSETSLTTGTIPETSRPELLTDRSQRFIGSIAMIITSELGDKTFFIAAIMAMRHRPLFVFSASYSAMILMTLLSMFLGLVIPTLLSRSFTSLIEALLFIIFALKMFKEAWETDKTLMATGEMEQVQHDLELTELDLAREKAELGGHYGEQDKKLNIQSGLKNLAALFFSPTWIQIFVMTFLAEWGDRSQIATVVMGAGEGFMAVLWGCLLGHFITTIVAVLGGRILASHLSLRTITISGAICFLLFGLFYFNDWVKQ